MIHCFCGSKVIMALIRKRGAATTNKTSALLVLAACKEAEGLFNKLRALSGALVQALTPVPSPLRWILALVAFAS
jgi:hypothetical protein